MKKTGLLLLLTMMYYANSTAQQLYAGFRQEHRLFTVTIDDSTHLVVTRKGDGKQLLNEDLTDMDAALRLTDTAYGAPYSVWDINFDGYEDISFPSVSGNVQQFQAVYLYNPSTESLELNDTLSNIACLSINESTKQITGSCFHSSAAENWVEIYAWKQGKLILMERAGTMPCPDGQDCYYDYRQKRVKGKMIYIYKDKIKR